MENEEKLLITGIHRTFFHSSLDILVLMFSENLGFVSCIVLIIIIYNSYLIYSNNIHLHLVSMIYK